MRKKTTLAASTMDEELLSPAADGRGGDYEEEPRPPVLLLQEHCYKGPDASAVAPSQAVPVVGVPNYPNCVKWSEENLLAVGAGHVVTILDPASMSGPRGFIPVAPSPVFNFGRVQPEDLRAHSLFQLCLARDPRPGVRSIDWSPPGLAQNGGSLLAMCTTDCRVKVYRAPFCDFQSEWVEIIDLSEMVFNYCLNNDFREAELAAAQLASEEETIPPPLKWGFRLKRKASDDEEPQHRKVQKARHHVTDKLVGGIDLVVTPPTPAVSPVEVVGDHGLQDPVAREHFGAVSIEADLASIERGSRVEVLEEDDDLQYWVGGSVVEIVHGEVLVKLDRPQYGAMEEWVPLLGQCTWTDNSDTGEETGKSYSVHSTGQEDGKQVLQVQRPRIRPQVAVDTLQKNVVEEAGGERSLVSGELVEAWVNHRWQEGMVVELHGSAVVVNFSSSSMSTIVELDKLRLAPFWHGERWIWKATSAVSNHRKGHQSSNDALVPSTVASTGKGMLKDVSGEQHAGLGGELMQSQGGTIKSGHVTTNLTLEQENISFPAQSGSEPDSPHVLTHDAKEKSYSRVYKRRGLVTAAGLPVDVSHSGTIPLATLRDTESCTTRPTRNRRLPSKLRNEDSVSWMTEADDSMLLENDEENENRSQHKDGDYVQKVTGVKAKHVRFVNDTGKVKQVKTTIKDSAKLGDTENQSKGSNVKQKWISAPDFAARSDILAPLALAWSSKYEDLGVDNSNEGRALQSFVLLGAGMKSGRVSLWRMAFPPSYAIDQVHTPVTASFLGFLFAHESWVTSLSWASCCNFDLGKLNPPSCPDGGVLSGDTLLLATGCADGSVKLWAGLSRELTGAPLVNRSIPFMCLRQAVKEDCVPVTALVLFVPPRPGDRALLAVGKGSGSVAVWELKASGVFRQTCWQPLAHHQMVTGFSWTSDGRCLYSCGQDSLKRWDFSDHQLLPLPFPDGSAVFPSNTASDVCSLEALESFFGITLSPNGLALAAVRGIASDLLDQMYQARSQKGMVQLFWLGNEHVDINKVNHATMHNIAHSTKAMTGHEKTCWELNIVEALQDLQDTQRTLVLWDIVAALKSLKEKIGVQGVVSILSKWLSSWAPGQGAVGAVESNEWSTGSFQKAISEASCRKLQILNVIYRRLFLSHVKAEVFNARSPEEHRSSKDDVEVRFWKDQMYLVEHELRQRLVLINLHSVTRKDHNIRDSEQGDDYVGIQLLVEWVLGNVPVVFPRLVEVANQLRNSESTSFVNWGESSPMEACNFCDSTVPFESPEVAICFGSDSKHRLKRCSVSMHLCPPVCLWHCGCCGRSAVKQASSIFFSVSSREQIEGLALPVVDHGHTFPSCPFCGVLMHRLLPNFFLTPSLV